MVAMEAQLRDFPKLINSEVRCIMKEGQDLVFGKVDGMLASHRTEVQQQISRCLEMNADLGVKVETLCGAWLGDAPFPGGGVLLPEVVGGLGRENQLELVGKKVQLCNLSDGSLNGLVGEVLSFDGSAERFEVALDSGGTRKAVRIKNLELHGEFFEIKDDGKGGTVSVRRVIGLSKQQHKKQKQ